MGASASVSKQDVSALSAEQKKALVAKLEPPYCEKKGVENESLTPLRDEFLQLNDGRPGSKALQDLQKEVVAAVGADELSSALASVRQPTGTSGAPKLAAVSPPKLDADDGPRDAWVYASAAARAKEERKLWMPGPISHAKAGTAAA